MATDATSPIVDIIQDVRETFLQWEYLRLVYNFVLIALTCISVFPQRPEAALQPEFIGRAAVGALGANLFYFAGPVADAYIRWLGLKNRTITYALFGAGLVLSCLVTLVACFDFVSGVD